MCDRSGSPCWKPNCSLKKGPKFPVLPCCDCAVGRCLNGVVVKHAHCCSIQRLSGCGIAVWTTGEVLVISQDTRDGTHSGHRFDTWPVDGWWMYIVGNPFKYVNALKPSDRCSTYLKSSFFFVVSTNKGNSLYNKVIAFITCWWSVPHGFQGFYHLVVAFIVCFQWIQSMSW